MKYQDTLALIGIIIVLTSLSACNAGSGDGLDAQGQPLTQVQPPDTSEPLPDSTPDPIDTPDPVEEGIQPTLASIQEEVFTPICSVCHGGASPAAGQNLSTIEDSIANLIDVQSSNVLFKRVLPGSPEESYLYLKITGASLAGSRMPLGQPSLSDEQIDAIKQWITLGALTPDNLIAQTVISRAKQTTTTQMRLTNTKQVTFWFNQSMDFSALTREQITLSLISTTSSGERVQLLPYDNATIKVINARVIEINIALPIELQTNFEPTRIAITLNSNSISTLTSSLGQTLDGDNNGFEGGEFTYDLFI